MGNDRERSTRTQWPRLQLDDVDGGETASLVRAALANGQSYADLRDLTGVSVGALHRVAHDGGPIKRETRHRIETALSTR
jgi:hypothetical protein